MPLFWKAYTSDVAQFLDELKQQRPALVEDQRRGRALLWDKAVDADAQQAWSQARVAQQAYVYQNKGS